jgi:Family of unknown function (DUF6524)
MEQLTPAGFVARFGAALALVLVTYNPSGYSFLHWCASIAGVQPLEVVAGLLLLGGWVFFAHATWRSLGSFGLLFALALCAAVVWLLVSWGWFSLHDRGVLTWLALAMLSLLLAIGVCWSQLRRRITGQVDVEETDHH